MPAHLVVEGTTPLFHLFRVHCLGRETVVRSKTYTKLTRIFPSHNQIALQSGISVDIGLHAPNVNHFRLLKHKNEYNYSDDEKELVEQSKSQPTQPAE